MLGFSPLASAPLADEIGVQEYQIGANAGSFALTGQAVSFTIVKAADAGSFTLTGQDSEVVAIGR